MATLNIEKSFLTENRSVFDFLDQSGQGLYIPLYQRDYSWDKDNIEQLLEDLTRGIERITFDEVTNDSNEIRFLGTIITVIEGDKNQIYPIDTYAVPPRVEKLIDGQQRVSTISLMSTLLTKRLFEIKAKVRTKSEISDDVEGICSHWTDKLEKIFSFDLGRGTPRLKPKIIRGAKDYWTRTDDIDLAYCSELSNYLARFIQAYFNITRSGEKNPLPSLFRNTGSRLYENGLKIGSWLTKIVSTAHTEDNGFSPAEHIISKFPQDMLWAFERPHLIDYIKERNVLDKRSDSYILCELVQTIAVCHYLLDRCCFTIIQPIGEDWAFDMFQSLNATGTPLTAIETFKPTIVHAIDELPNYEFKGSRSDTFFKKVEDFLSESGSAQQKNKRTNDFLTSFFTAYDGRAISTHFSYQRKNLTQAYSSLTGYEEKERFIVNMGNYAEFYQNWLKYDGKDGKVFPLIEGVSNADLASMLLLFLKGANHKMAITMLGCMYAPVIEGKSGGANDFIQTIKLIAAYYFLWRTTHPNTGLDTTYRDFFKHNKDSLSVDIIKDYLQKMLEKKDIGDKESWTNKAKNYLKYDTASKEVIRLSLLIVAHDTIPDPDTKGLIKIRQESHTKPLYISKLPSLDLKTIEHIAPGNNKNSLWDASLYDALETYQSLGNLTLLPKDLNSSAGNKFWIEKLLYYQTVAEKDPQQIEGIEHKALKENYHINPDTIALLKGCNFNEHLSSISKLSTNDIWDKSLVDKRTTQMLDIIWDRVAEWIYQ